MTRKEEGLAEYGMTGKSSASSLLFSSLPSLLCSVSFGLLSFALLSSLAVQPRLVGTGTLCCYFVARLQREDSSTSSLVKYIPS
jgi:hypothetical protein